MQQNTLKEWPTLKTDSMSELKMIFNLSFIFSFRNWEDISLNDEMTEYDRSKFALWHYPVPNKYSKVFFK